jgi:hypothetical protein
MKKVFSIFVLLAAAFSASAQTPPPVSPILVIAEQFSTALPKPVIQTTGDPAPSNGTKIVLVPGGAYGYTVPVVTSGSYGITVRIDGPATLHFEMPLGTRVSDEVNASSTAWTTYTPTQSLSLFTGNELIYVVVDTVGVGVPAMDWFKLTYLPPPVIDLNVTGSILFDDKTPVSPGSPLNVQQSDNSGGFVNAGIITSDSLGNLTGTFTINPKLVTSGGFVTFSFSVNGVGATVSQTFPLQVFQQGSTGINLSLVLFKSIMLPKSFGAGLLP